MKNTSEIKNTTNNEAISPEEYFEKVKALTDKEEQVKMLLPYLDMPDVAEFEDEFWGRIIETILIPGITNSQEDVKRICDEADGLEYVFENITYECPYGDLPIDGDIPSEYDIMCDLINQNNPILSELEIDMNEYFNTGDSELEERLPNDPRDLAEQHKEFIYENNDLEDVKDIILCYSFWSEEKIKKHYEARSNQVA